MAETDSVSAGRVVGALACQLDSYLKTLDTEVISCVKALADASKISKKKKQEATPQDEWLIECADSVLFPEGGGQPSDHGTIILLSDPDQTTIPIKNVQRHGLRCIIYSPQPLSPGDKIRQEVDWARRWDHMQQHTGQHLLSAIMMNNHGLKTLGWGMGAAGTMNYVDLPRKPTKEEMQDIQSQCSELIRDNLPVRVETPDDAKHDKLPGDYDKSEGIVRVIHIGDIDINTCCGTHLSQTSHISLIILGSTQSVHGKNCRLSFMTGDRAVSLANASVGAISSIAKLMSSNGAPTEVLAKASNMCDAVTELRRVEKKLLLEVAKYESERVIGVIRSGKNAWVHRSDGGMDFINKIIGETKEDVQGTGLVVVFAIGESKGTGPVAIVGDKDSVEAMAVKVKGVVKDIKGGGGGGKWQGKVKEWQHSELTALEELVES
ncbi:hypothetical protein ACHAPT_005435 [Fusarium lateritium]